MTVEESQPQAGRAGFSFQGFNIFEWGAFKVPAFALLATALLLLFRDSANGQELQFIQSLVKFAIGSSIISYGQSLLHSNFHFLRDAKDLPTWLQAVCILLHGAWFTYWLACIAG